MIIADFEVSTNLDFAKVIARALLKRSGERKKTFKIKWFSGCFQANYYKN
jgi:hypothetical protein